MKLLFENWRRFVNEELNKEVELYHATNFPVKDFLNGIVQKRAKGFGQGEGFYLWRNKDRAVDYAKQQFPDEGGPKNKKAIIYKGEDSFPKIIILKLPLTTENFDIDYEVGTRVLPTMMLKEKDKFIGLEFDVKEQPDGFGENETAHIRYRIRKITPPRGSRGKAKVHVEAKNITRGETKYRTRRKVGEEYSGTIGGQITGQMMRKIAKEFPDFFKSFEEAVLDSVEALKYNGEETIYPVRVEDLDGNTIWSK